MFVMLDPFQSASTAIHVHRGDVIHGLLIKLEVENAHVFNEAVFIYSFWNDDDSPLYLTTQSVNQAKNVSPIKTFNCQISNFLCAHLPPKDDLCRTLSQFLGELYKLRIFQKFWVSWLSPWAIWRAKWTVGCNIDAFLLAEVDKLCLVKVRMALHLEHGRLDSGHRQNPFQLLTVEVGHADGFDKALLDTLLHRLPRVHIVNLAEQKVAVSILWKQLTILLVTHRPVN